MISVDSRVGSVELCPILESLGVKVESKTLEFGDVAFEGHGPNGKCLVGIERKTLSDMLNSMRSGRFNGYQFPGMLKSYDFTWLVVEGVWRANPSTGILEKLANGKWYEVRLGRQAFMHSELDRFLCSLEIKSPIHVRHTGSIHETAVAVWNLYHWFTNKEWSEHKSFNVLYDPVQPPVGLLVKPSLAQRWAKDLDGVGWEKSKQAAKHFGSALDLAIASEEDWDKIPGIGKVLSKRIVEAINGKT